MTGRELKQFFKEHMVPSKLYKIGGHHNRRICMEKSEGSEGGWDVFFSEKKNRVGLMHYSDEASACQSMKNELRKMMEMMYGLTWSCE